jgi:hypothetical protein
MGKAFIKSNVQKGIIITVMEQGVGLAGVAPEGLNGANTLDDR